MCSLQKSEGIDANFPSVFGPAKVSGMQATRSLDIICVLIRVSNVPCFVGIRFVVLAVVVMISDDGDQQIQMLLMTGKMIVEDDGIFVDF